MPHSSGGGSHGGGSHGGSSGGSGGSSRPSGPRRSYYPGARRYVYYRNRMPVYYYSDKDPEGIIRQRRNSVIMMGVFWIMVCIAILITVLPPSKMDGYADTAIQIEDRADILGDTGELYRTMEAFQDKTGITPAVYTVENSEWETDYYSLENYAYDLYVNEYADESHWLLVYSTDGENDDFENWYWEGMQGDDTDEILSSDKLSTFNSVLHKNLTARTRYTVAEAFTDAFTRLNADVMKASPAELFAAVFSVIIFGIFWLATFFSYRLAKKRYSNAQWVGGKEKTVEIKCDYCGGIYVKGTVSNCPHCGAPAKIE